MVVQKHDVEDFLNFFKFPYALLREERFRDLSLLSKVLYSIALDRSNLSLRNRWIDEHGVYIIYKVETMMEDTGKSNKTISNAKNELVKVGLIEIKKQFNGADLIYVNKISDVLHGNVKITRTEVKNLHDEDVKITRTEVKNLHSNQTNYSQTNLTRLIEPDDDVGAGTLYSNSTIGRALRENGIRVNHRHHQELLEYVGRENMSFDMIVRAIEITADSEKPSFKYLRGILENWRKQGFTSLEQVEEHERQRKQPKQQEYDGIGNIPEWSSMHPKNANKPKKESGYNSKEWQKWLEEKKNGQ